MKRTITLGLVWLAGLGAFAQSGKFVTTDNSGVVNYPTNLWEANRTTLSNLLSLSLFVPNSRAIATAGSLTGGGDLSANRTVQLVGDNASPGASTYYGTDGSGTKGFFPLPAGGSTNAIADAPSNGVAHVRRNGAWNTNDFTVITGTASDTQIPAAVARDAEVTSLLSGYQLLDADLTDLADGSLSGSKVGTGIDGANITVGTTGTGLLVRQSAAGGSSIGTNGAVVGYPAVYQPDGTIATTNSATVSNLTVTGTFDLGTNVVPLARGGTGGTNAAQALAAIGAQAADADLDDLADGSLTGSKIGTGIDASNITAGTLDNLRLDSDLQDLADGSLSGSKVGSGIDAANITTGTIDNPRLDADLQDLADGSLSGSKVGTGIDGDNITLNTTGTGPLVRQSAASGTFAWDVDFRYSLTNTDTTLYQLWSNSIPDGQTRFYELNVVQGGATNGFSGKLFARYANRSGSMSGTNWSSGGGMDANATAFITNVGTAAALLVRGPLYQPQAGQARGTYQVVTNAGAYASSPTLDTNGFKEIWKLNESGTGDRTSSVYSLVLTATNTPASIAGVEGNAVRFQRQNSQSLGIATTNLLESDPNRSFTIGCWVLLNALPTSGQIYGLINKADFGVNNRIEYALGLDYNASGAVPWFQTGTNLSGSASGVGTYKISSANLITGTNVWVPLFGGRDAASGSNWISVAGAPKEWVAAPVGPGPSITPFRLGVNGSTTHFLMGNMDYAQLWWTNLTMTQIGFLTNNPPPTLP